MPGNADRFERKYRAPRQDWTRVEADITDGLFNHYGEFTVTLEELMRDAELGEHVSLARPTGAYPKVLEDLFPQRLMVDAVGTIKRWPGYVPTQLHPLSALANSCQVASVHYKDESTRFGLGSFKALGGAYAVIRHLADLISADLKKPISAEAVRAGDHSDPAARITVASATDGNHGRSVAWGARQAGCRCKIYIHRDVSPGREKAMADLGAEVIRVDGDYDESVHQCARDARAQGWHVISDTSYPGYMEIPKLVMAGYTVMVDEILEQLAGIVPTHVIVQAGVGGLAASMIAAFWMRAGVDLPRFIIVESEHAACILESAKQGAPAPVQIDQETIMAGLSCGEISLIAWEILQRGAADVVTIADQLVEPVMRMAARAQLGNMAIEAGECGTPGIITLAALSKSETLKARVGLNESSRVLVFGCEGATDADIYQRIVAA